MELFWSRNAFIPEKISERANRFEYESGTLAAAIYKKTISGLFSEDLGLVIFILK